jgi:hypothetical protein
MAKELSTTQGIELDALRERVRALDERVAALGRHL